MEVWPSSVPSIPISDSMKGKPFRAPHETDMEDGQKRRRRSTTKNIATYSFLLMMTGDEFRIFQLWVRETLVDGTLSFVAPVYTPTGVANRICSFSQPYDHDAADGILHAVSVTLDIEDY